MTRLLNTLKLDVALQQRNGLYLFTAVSTAAVILAMRQFVPQDALSRVLPVLFFFYVGATSYLFIAAQVLFEKAQRTVDALAVTPLHVREYLLSKVLSLTALASVEGLAILLLSYGLELNLPLLVLGVIAQSALTALAGLIVVVRFSSATNFLILAPLYLTPLFVPAVGLLGLYDSALYYLWPTQAPLTLIQAAFHGAPTWQLGYALCYAILTLIVGFVWAQRAYERFVVAKAGN